MNLTPSQCESLLRLLEGRASGQEQAGLNRWLRAEPEARAFLREIAEQSVMIADLEQTALGCVEGLKAPPHTPPQPVRRFFSWRWAAIAVGLCCLTALAAIQLFLDAPAGFVRVTKVTGSSQYFSARGKVDHALNPGKLLGAGDTLETRSCDAWIELELRDGSTLTIAGHSTLRVLETEAQANRFELQQGNLWLSPSTNGGGNPMVIQTPTATAETRGAQFDVQTSASDTMLRVNQGSVRLIRRWDESEVVVPTGHRVAASLASHAPWIVTPQPQPVNHWSCDLWQVPEVILGKWLPAVGPERARLGAEPLLWPLPQRDPVLLYAVALAAWKTSERPVLLQSDSTLRIRGRTERPHTVRFGFSTQKMRGVFAGKFEVDVEPHDLGRTGETWQVDLPLADFRPLQPQLSASPDGLELTDIYALTVVEDAGLEINRFELIPGADSGY